MARTEREVLPRDVGGVHESALRYCEHRHAFLIGTGRPCMALAAARFGRSAARARARGRACGDRNRAGAGGKFECARFEFIQRPLVLKKDDLAIGFAACLKSDADLTHGGIADVTSMRIYTAFAECSAHAERAFTDGRKDRVPIAPAEEGGAFDGVSEQFDGIGIIIRVSHPSDQ